MTTRDTLTDEQIERLQHEAGRAGDMKMAAICALALEGNHGARRECLRVIRDNEAQS